ncbi:RNA 2',3'-cyclic phosphodiesterase [Fodinibius halophilus]|uniref:RNA 2',3'-cyclic phosphodiesterase n=1 Tax=Fodinibius halophilus TaxID=1736908 RepID=A0A6M1SY72_9BACT|nr:RNA 2',3'-cyclic phosphodiesterase [Fodinibius halophilus]NGP88346.1 RNA 2',3'-cyclic phosphodiesterase [Fodinibius halophilus]
MRLFIAIPIPETVKQRLAELQQSMEGVRWQSKEQIHLTLKFLGETEPDRVEQLKERLSEVRHPVFSLIIKGLGFFSRGSKPRVLWAGIVNNDRLDGLHNKIEKICTSMGFKAEVRPFKPHITLARLKGISKRKVTSFIDQHKQFQLPKVQIHEFALYESKLDSEGAVHHRLKTIKLGNN